jgi:hypothetical protein
LDPGIRLKIVDLQRRFGSGTKVTEGARVEAGRHGFLLSENRKACRDGRLFCFYSISSEYQTERIKLPNIFGDFGL